MLRGHRRAGSGCRTSLKVALGWPDPHAAGILVLRDLKGHARVRVLGLTVGSARMA